MERMSCDVLVVGAGTAGLKAYKAAVARGAGVLLVEKGPGGSTCTRVGCMPSKLLIAAGRLAHDARRAAGRGVHVGAVEIDGPAVLRKLRAERDRFVRSVLDDYHAIPDGHRLQGEARFTGPTSVVVGEIAIDAAAIVVATGGHPVVPDGLDVPPALIHTHETIFEIEELPATMAVLGAGPLGLELAQAFARLGVEVIVLDSGKTVGGLSDPAADDEARKALSREVTIHLGVEATASSERDRARVTWAADARRSRPRSRRDHTRREERAALRRGDAAMRRQRDLHRRRCRWRMASGPSRSSTRRDDRGNGRRGRASCPSHPRARDRLHRARPRLGRRRFRRSTGGRADR
jgi:dihydrolipoamide dehydrogenase